MLITVFKINGIFTHKTKNINPTSNKNKNNKLILHIRVQKNLISLSLEGFNLLLRSEIVRPIFENTLSLGTEVLGGLRYFFANFARVG